MNPERYNPEDFALQIFKDRYAIHPNETFEEACKRVANFASSAEDGEKRKIFETRFEDILAHNRGTVGGRIWRNAGRKRGSCGNCYILQADDSREGWGQLLKEITIISGLGGGVGINFDNIRPRGSEIKGIGGIATGAVSLMKIVNGVCNELRSGGSRRSALLFGLSYWHPDIEEFLDVKLDKKELNNANISVLVDNKFFDLVEADGDIELKWQGKILKTIKAKWLYDKVVKNALQSGDPGFINLGLANEMNNLFFCGRPICCTNPCLSSRCKVLTKSRLKEIKDLIIGEEIWSESGWTKVTNIIPRGIKSVYKFHTTNGYLECTKDHRVVKDGTKYAISEVDSIDVLSGPTNSLYINSCYIDRSATIKQIDFVADEEVFDITVDNSTHTFWCNGFNVANCGEIMGSPYTVCNLGSIVLSTHVDETGQIDWGLLNETVSLMVRLLDNIIDVNEYPFASIKEWAHKERKVGLGVTGLHDMLLKMGIKYSSERAIKVVDEVMAFIKKKAYETSIFLSVEKGQFALLDRQKFIESGFCKKSLTKSLRAKILEYGIRNSSLLTIAPNGTISIVANCSSGVEPMFAPVYLRTFNKHNECANPDKDVASEIVIHPLLKKFIENGLDYSHFEGAHEITPDQHCRIQAVCQKHICNSISKTINLPEIATAEELSLIILSHIRNLKGMTVYRDGSKGLSPIKPLGVQEAQKYLDQCKIEITDNSCPKGVCDIT